jgi:hypothetical protein
MPVISLIQNFVHLAILQFDAWIPHSALLVLSCVQATGWLVISALWTTCEVSGRDAPAFCPQNFKSSVVIHGQHMMGVTIFKNVLAWTMVGIHIGLALTARKGIYHDRRVQWRAKDEFHELTEYEPRMSFTAYVPRGNGTFGEMGKSAAETGNAGAGVVVTKIPASYETKI